MKGYIKLFLSLIILATFACREKSRLDKSLQLAKNNRSEIENVLKHYSINPQDSMKLKAAVFIIESIYDYSFPSSENLNIYYLQLDSIYSLNGSERNINQTQLDLYNQLSLISDEITMIKDLEYLSSRLLIENIDLAFESWQKPWNKYLSFDEFCEYLLPYKIDQEVPDNWRSNYNNKFSFFSDNVDSINVLSVIDSINKYREGYITSKSVLYGGCNPNLLLNMKLGTCEDYTILGTYAFRSIGIPVSIDFTPQWANRSKGHSWLAIHLNDTLYDYSFPEPSYTLGNHLQSKFSEYYNVASKIYRRTFASQNNLILNNKVDEKIPDFFKNPYFIDVTDEYIECTDAKISIEKNTGNKMAYLCSFNNKEWIPVHWGNIDENEILFTKMGREAVYLPCKFTENEILSAIAYPFIIKKDGLIKKLNPDTCNLQIINLNRKYPDSHIKKYAAKLVGSQIQVSNDINFENYITAYTIASCPESRYNIIELTNIDKPFQYIRFLLGPNSNGGDLAEFEIYEHDSSQKILGNPVSHHDGRNLEAAFDGNVLSYYYSTDPNEGSIGLNLLTPKMISNIRYLPRNDGNFIIDGELYELFYWDYKWVSLGKKIGTCDQLLEYKNAPTNALFLLRNLTKGIEERIFTYDNDQQMWW